MMFTAVLFRKLLYLTYGVFRALLIRGTGIHLLQLCNSKIFGRAQIIIMGTVPDLPGHRINIRRCRGMVGIKQGIHGLPDLTQHFLFPVIASCLYGDGYQAVGGQVPPENHFIQQPFHGLIPGLMPDIHIPQDNRAVIIIRGRLQNAPITVKSQ